MLINVIACLRCSSDETQHLLHFDIFDIWVTPDAGNPKHFCAIKKCYNTQDDIIYTINIKHYIEIVALLNLVAIPYQYIISFYFSNLRHHTTTWGINEI